jgi:hypothetical protein
VAIAYKQVHEVPVPPSSYRRDTPKRLELIVLKALKKNKKDRYKSAEEMLNDLDTVDVNDVVVRPTVSFSLHKYRPKGEADESDFAEKRITDRRSAERRRAEAWRDYSVFSRDFWIDVVHNQGIALALIALLAIILAFHLLNHP